MTDEETRTTKRSGQTTGIVLIAVGVVGGFAIPMLMTGGNSGDAGLIGLIFGAPIGFGFALFFVIAGIIVLVSSNREPSSPSTTHASSDKSIKKPGRYQG